MKTLLLSSTAAGLAMMLALPGEVQAQAACAPRFADQTYPCTMPSGKVAESRLDALLQRERAQVARIEQLEVELAQANRGAGVGAGEIAAELETIRGRLADVRAMINRTRTADAEQQSQSDRAEADRAALEKRQREADRAALEKRQREADLAAQERRQREADRAAMQERQREAELEEREAQLRKERRELERQRKEAEKRAARRANRQQAQTLAGKRGLGRANRVETEELTDEDVRDSSEEFATNVTGDGDEKKDDGLSKFEKALLLGLGAVAVGTVLKNGDEVLSRSGDRVVVERDGDLRVLKNDDALLRQAGNDLRTETFDDGSTRTTVTKPDGSRIVTIRSNDGTVLRRVRITPEGQEYTLFDDTRPEPQIEVSALPQARTAFSQTPLSGEEELRAALEAQQAYRQGEGFSLRQIREIPQVRALAPEVQLDAVEFASGSAAIRPEQARSLARIGDALRKMIEDDPRTVLLVEGHTDAVGDATYNLALSDRRAETVALALSEYFDVPAENMIVQGYGESQLKVPTLDNEPANRRAVVRNISGLLR